MSKLSVVDLPVGNFLDIPGMLRRIADDMTSGESKTPDRLIMIAELSDGSLDVYGLGGYADTARIVGLLTLAQHRMIAD